MSSNRTAQPRHVIVDTLYNMGFPHHYVTRSLSLYEKHYNIIKIGYHIEIITEIIFRLTIKDKLKQSQTIYCSKVNVKQALESMGFCSQQIDIAIEEYNLYKHCEKTSYDIQIITKTIMNSLIPVATDYNYNYRKKQQQQLLKTRMDQNDKLHEQRSNSRNSFDTNDTNDTGDTQTDNNHNYNNYNSYNYSGYLWKQSSKQRKKWQKRWFILHDGELQYFKDSDMATKFFQSEKNQNVDIKTRKEYIGNIALCKVNKIVSDKHKYVISVTTPLQRTYVLKMFSISDYDNWFNVLSSQKEQLLVANDDYDVNTYTDEEKCEYKQTQRLLFKIQNDNKLCADCNALSPEWISINIGVLLCFDCAAIHRDLRCGVTKIQSLMLDNLDINTLKCIVNIGGNQKLNGELLEYNLCKSHKINYKMCNVKRRAEFICFKYVKKMYINTNNLTNKDFNQYLFDCAVNNDCFGIIFALCNGADVNHSFKINNGMTALQASILRNNDEAERILFANDASPMVQI